MAYIKKEGYYEITDGEKKAFIPSTMAALLDDESGMLVFRNVAGRKNAAKSLKGEN